jgi:hypothetical protein
MHIKLEFVGFVHVTWWILSIGVDFLDRMLMEGIGMVTLKNVCQPGRIGKAEYAISIVIG